MERTLRIEMPEELATFRFPDALQERLQNLLDQQDLGQLLIGNERREAEGLVDLAEWISLVRARAELARTET